MIRSICISIIITLLLSCVKKQTNLVIIGTVHEPAKNFNPDSLYNILVQVKPDVILYELDSTFFDSDFNFTKELFSNEFIATTRYTKNHNTIVRPYDFTGRNQHRINIGSRPTDGKVHELLDSLYLNGFLVENHHRIMSRYKKINKTLISKAYGKALDFNNAETDSISQLHQDIQYKKINVVVKAIPLFSEKFQVLPYGDSITFAEGYQRAENFWHLRNKTMAANIQKFIQAYEGKTIVVLNGFFHRYYLNKELRPYQDSMGFRIYEFYNFK